MLMKKSAMSLALAALTCHCPVVSVSYSEWIRPVQAGVCKCIYLDEVLMQKRKIDTSMSANRLKYWQNEQLNSVFKVCERAFALCKTKAELKALRERLAYEYRQCIRTNHSGLAQKYLGLYRQTGGNTWFIRLVGQLIGLGFDRRRA